MQYPLNKVQNFSPFIDSMDSPKNFIGLLWLSLTNVGFPLRVCYALTLLVVIAGVFSQVTKSKPILITLITFLFERFLFKVLQAYWVTTAPTSSVVGGDLGPTFRNTCGNLCETVKKARRWSLFCLILSFYPQGMAFEVFPFSPIILHHCNMLFRFFESFPKVQ